MAKNQGKKRQTREESQGTLGLSKMEKRDGKREKKWGSDEEKVRKGKQVKEGRGQQERKQNKSMIKGRTRGRKFGNQEVFKFMKEFEMEL